MSVCVAGVGDGCLRVDLCGGLDLMHQHERRGCHMANSLLPRRKEGAEEGALGAQPDLMYDLETRYSLTLNDLRDFCTPKT